MKRIRCFVFCLVLMGCLIGVISTASAVEDNKTKVIFTPSVSKEIFSLKKGDTEFFPIRKVMECMGEKVTWNNGAKEIKTEYHDYNGDAIVIKFKPGEKQYLKNGEGVKLAEEAIVCEGKAGNEVYVPESFFSELLNIELVFES